MQLLWKATALSTHSKQSMKTCYKYNGGLKIPTSFPSLSWQSEASFYTCICFFISKSGWYQSRDVKKQLPSLVSKRTRDTGDLLVLRSPKLPKASPADDTFHLAVLLLLLPAQSLLTVFQPWLVLHQQLLHLLLLHQESPLILFQPAAWHLQALLQLRYLLFILQVKGKKERIRCKGKRKGSDHYNLLLLFREGHCFFFHEK